MPLFETPRPAFDALVSGTWLPLMGQPGEYTERGRRFDSVVKHLSGGDVPLRLDGMRPRYIMNLNPRDPGPARAQEFSRHADTRGIVYDIDPGLGLDAGTLNREIRRVAPAPGARSRDANPVFAELTGKIRVPLMTLHETADFRVPFRLEQSYRRRAQAAGTGHLLVQRAVRWAGHCSFDGVAREQAFGDLVAWMERGVVPAGTTCSATWRSSGFAGPRRFTRTIRHAGHEPHRGGPETHRHVPREDTMRAPHRFAFWAGMAASTALVAGTLMASTAGAATFVYVGNAESNEVYVLQLNRQNGDLTVIEKTPIPGIESPGSRPRWR